MKISLNHDELSDLEAMDDAALAKLVRDSLKQFRARDENGEDNELENANPGTPSHSGPSTSTLARAAHDSALQRYNANLRQAERDREAAALIKGYNRL